MKRVLRIATACLVMIALLVLPVAPCFAANNQQNTISSSQLAASQSVQTQGAKQILEQAIKDIQALSNPNPDEKPSYNGSVPDCCSSRFVSPSLSGSSSLLIPSHRNCGCDL